MACGTPVIGFRRGAIPEVVVDAETGFVVNDAGEMAEAVWWTGEINPHACRAHVEIELLGGTYGERVRSSVPESAE